MPLFGSRCKSATDRRVFYSPGSHQVRLHVDLYPLQTFVWCKWLVQPWRTRGPSSPWKVHLSFSSFCRKFFKELIDGASTSIYLWQTVPTARCEKKYRRLSHRLHFFNSFQVCHLVILFTTRTKKWDHCTDDKPLIILYISIKSALFRLSFSDHNPSLLSRFSYGKDFKL